MDRNDRLGTRGDPLLDLARTNIESLRIDIGEDGRGPNQAYCIGRGNEGEGRDDDFIAGANAAGEKPQNQGIGAGGHSYAETAAAIFCNFLLKLFDFRAENEVLPMKGSVNCSLDFFLDDLIWCFEIKDRNCSLKFCYAGHRG